MGTYGITRYVDGQAIEVIPPPTCWQFFGFNGPTNKHNLDSAYSNRMNSFAPTGYANAMYSAYIQKEYDQCVEELRAAQEISK